MLFVSLIALVDINKANVKELSSLSGIGTKKAEGIVEYRESNGCFKDIDALVKVKGIGKKIIQKNRDNLEASKCEK
jgi:competence protein ComEA